MHKPVANNEDQRHADHAQEQAIHRREETEAGRDKEPGKERNKTEGSSANSSEYRQDGAKAGEQSLCIKGMAGRIRLHRNVMRVIRDQAKVSVFHFATPS